MHRRLREAPLGEQRRAMPRPPDNVIPFRRKPRKWTRPEDFGHDPGKPPKPPKRPKRGWLRKLAAWALIAAVIALAVGYSLWR
jgi:hypothetical protein